MRFEQVPTPPTPEREKLAVDRIESGDLSKLERESLISSLSQAERYGLNLPLRNYNEERRSMDVLDNVFLIQEEVDQEIDDLQRVAYLEAYFKLPPEQKALYDKLVYSAPEVLKEEGIEWQKPEAILEAPNVRDMPEEELERIMKKKDYQEAMRLYEDKNAGSNPMTGELLPKLEEDPEGRRAALVEVANIVNENRKAFQEAARLKRKAGKIISNDFGYSGGKEYLEEIKKRLAISK